MGGAERERTRTLLLQPRLDSWTARQLAESGEREREVGRRRERERGIKEKRERNRRADTVEQLSVEVAVCSAESCPCKHGHRRIHRTHPAVPANEQRVSACTIYLSPPNLRAISFISACLEIFSGKIPQTTTVTSDRLFCAVALHCLGKGFHRCSVKPFHRSQPKWSSKSKPAWQHT